MVFLMRLERKPGGVLSLEAFCLQCGKREPGKKGQDESTEGKGKGFCVRENQQPIEEEKENFQGKYFYMGGKRVRDILFLSQKKELCAVWAGGHQPF